MANTVGMNGELVIEPHVRERLRVAPGSVAIQEIVEDHLEVRFLPAGHAVPSSGEGGASSPDYAMPSSAPPVQLHNRSLAGMLRPHARRVATSEEDWQAIKYQAWSDAVQEEADKWLKESVDPPAKP
jgi:hypothetical protein